MMASCSTSRPAKKAKGESATVPNWLELPRDVTASIFHRLDITELVTSVSQVCLLWRNICKDPLMWRTIDLSDPSICPYKLVKICRCMVERSGGQLEDINIEYIGTDNLLQYIADSASHLRRMRLAKCWRISSNGLRQAAKKLLLLEELEISFMNISTVSLEFIGQCCPLLKSLKHSTSFCNEFQYDGEAFAIAKTMPQLRHLKIFGHLLTNVGLLAILDGCPILESLDLRECYNLDLTGSLGKRCHQQITDLLLPTDYLAQSYDNNSMVRLDSIYFGFLHNRIKK